MLALFKIGAKPDFLKAFKTSSGSGNLEDML